jgi:tRNA (guanine37-N1)-methyltransferase
MKNSPLFSATALTLFPEMFPGPLGHSLAGTALKKNIWSLETVNIRDFATDKHKTVDDSPYGGGTGMVMKPDVVHAAIEHAKLSTQHSVPILIYLTPRGVPLTQRLVEKLSREHLVILCGRFEGVDQRVINHHQMLEISLGDFILSGGEIAALALLDACVRLLPGVIGKEESTRQESFATTSNYAGLLEYPHYTRPPLWNGMGVPDVLLSGNHAEIDSWRLEQAKHATEARRPDLIKQLKNKG